MRHPHRCALTLPRPRLTLHPALGLQRAVAPCGQPLIEHTAHSGPKGNLEPISVDTALMTQATPFT